MISLIGKTFCVFGLRGSGKSTLVNCIATHFGASALIYDTVHEIPESAAHFSYQPRNRYSVSELNEIIEGVLKLHRFTLFMIDEANRFCPSKPAPLPQKVQDLNDMCRHYGLGAGYVARRPVQLNQDLTELAEYLFIFHLAGKADIAYLNDISQGLGDAVLALPNFYFVLVSADRSYEVYNPITPDQTWLGRRDAGATTGLDK